MIPAMVSKRQFDEVHNDVDRALDHELYQTASMKFQQTCTANAHFHEQVISALPGPRRTKLEAASGFEPEYGALQAPA